LFEEAEFRDAILVRLRRGAVEPESSSAVDPYDGLAESFAAACDRALLSRIVGLDFA
jgi:hypothetical protein